MNEAQQELTKEIDRLRIINADLLEALDDLVFIVDTTFPGMKTSPTLKNSRELIYKVEETQ